MKLLITCEHGGNRIPARYGPLFHRHRGTLDSHRGYDPGALALARDFAAAFDAKLVYSTTSRLLVELNRSADHPKIFSEMTRGLPPGERERIMQRHYVPYRSSVEAQVSSAAARNEPVLHISCHSFTPCLDGIVRRADVGLLYDPARRQETAFCQRWQRELRALGPRLIVRRNYPYRGYDDGLTTSLRRRFPGKRYRGIELEVNQKYPLGDSDAWHALRKILITSLERAFGSRE